MLTIVNTLKNKLLKDSFGGFVKRGGIYIFLSTLLIKILGAALSIIIVRFLTQDDFGNISFALSIIAIVTVFAGLGANWSLLRFGPTLSSFSEKFQLFRYSLKKGSLYTIFLIAIIAVISCFLPQNFLHSRTYLIILSFSLLTQFLFESFNSYLRIINKNKAYSYSNIIGSISIFLIGIFLCYFFKGIGYALALVFAPLIAVLFFYRRIFTGGKSQMKIQKNKFWTYGVYTGIGTIANQMIISLGPIIPGYLNASAQEIALFKVATIIPFNLLILPGIIMTTDFVHISKNFNNAIILKNYYYNYVKTTFLISLIPFILLFLFNEQIVLALFGQNYSSSVPMSMNLNISVFFAFLFRVPLGNMLSAIGKANWNVVHTFFWLILFIPACYFVYPVWGMNGISILISFIFIFSGFISLGMFYYYLKSIRIPSY